jgi:hypothetical protein
MVWPGHQSALLMLDVTINDAQRRSKPPSIVSIGPLDGPQRGAIDMAQYRFSGTVDGAQFHSKFRSNPGTQYGVITVALWLATSGCTIE